MLVVVLVAGLVVELVVVLDVELVLAVGLGRALALVPPRFNPWPLLARTLRGLLSIRTPSHGGMICWLRDGVVVLDGECTDVEPLCPPSTSG